MKITKENFEKKFDTLFEILNTIKEVDNREISDAKREIADKLKEKQEGCKELLRDNNVLRIGIVGQVKAGKSSFLNSLFFNGENMLPRASTPMTAGLTILQYGEKNTFEVEYYNATEWQYFKDRDIEYNKYIDEARTFSPQATVEELTENMDESLLAAHELVSKCCRKAESCINKESKRDSHPFDDIQDLQDVLEDYVGANGTYTPVVKSLTVNLNDQRLEGVQVIDTPGVNDPIVSREQRTRECLRSCHGVFLLSYSGRFFDQVDVSFLTNRIGEQGIGEVVVIASKFDSVLQDVGNKSDGDFLGAINDCQNSLRMQMENNLKNSEFKGKDPELDFSSGIGFSIAKKDFSKLDSIEKNVVEQMRRFYPSFFTDVKECKENFEMLSAIDDIKEKFLEGAFKNKKEEIIESKLNSYFENASKGLYNVISTKTERIQQMLKTLEENDINDIKKQKKEYVDIIKTIKNDIESIAKRAEAKAEKAEKEARNSFSLNLNQLPLVDKTVHCNRQSTFWGMDKGFCVIYKEVDINSLNSSLRDAFRKSKEQIEKKWKKESEDIISFIKNAIGDIIAEREKMDTEGKLDTRLLRNILFETIDEMESASILDWRGIENDYSNQMDNCLQSQSSVRTSFGKMEEHEARNKVTEDARRVRNAISSHVNNLISVTTTQIESEIKVAREKFLEGFTDNKADLIKSFEDRIGRYVEELERSLNDKEKNVTCLSIAVETFTKMKEEIK